MTNLFLSFVNRSISAGWLILAVILLRQLLKRTPKWLNVALWGLAGIRLAFPFSIQSIFSLIPSSETISPEIMQASEPMVNTGIPALNQAVNPVISASFAPSPTDSANPLQIWIPVCSILWIGGMVCLLSYAVISYWRLRRRVAEAVPMGENIYQCERVDSPFVLGLIRPRIYLPSGFCGQTGQVGAVDFADPADYVNAADFVDEAGLGNAADLTETADYVNAAALLPLSAMIAHEQAHIRRRDHWWKPLGFLLLALYWFHPLVWAAYVLLCRDIEFACDEKVIRELDNDRRADYSQALLACSVSRKGISACPLAFGEAGVKERVKSVLNYRRPAFWLIAVAVVVCGAVALCFLTDPAGSRETMAWGRGLSADQATSGQTALEPATSGQATLEGSGSANVPSGDGGSAGEPEKSVFQDAAIWEDADLDHDGETELILVREHNGGEFYELEVVKQDGTVLWSRDMGTVHTGQGAILLYESGGKDYLVEYLPAIYQGMGSYTCTQFSLEGGVETEDNQWTAEFQMPVQEMTGKMRAFAEVGNMIMKDGTVLLSTVEGETVVGPVAAAEVAWLYPVSFGMEENMQDKADMGMQDETESGMQGGADVGMPDNMQKDGAASGQGQPLDSPFGENLFRDGGPLEFLFASGAGGWGTTLTLYSDGRFEGSYVNGESVAAPEYPRGTSYICKFSGQFSGITRISDYAYSMRLEELAYETETDKTWIEDGIRYIGADALGIAGGEEFILYLPDTPPEELDEEFLYWWPDYYLWNRSAGSVKKLYSYGIQNVNTSQGFFTSWLL